MVYVVMAQPLGVTSSMQIAHFKTKVEAETLVRNKSVKHPRWAFWVEEHEMEVT